MDSYKFKNTDSVKKYIFEQIWEIKNAFNYDINKYSEISEIENNYLMPFINQNTNINNILDLGCGLGRCGVYLYNTINKDHKIKFYFCDSDTGAKGDGGTKQGNDYNSLDMTNLFIKSNNLINYEVIDFNKQNLSTLPKLDIVLSMYSVGLHYPIEIYLNDLLKVIDNNTIMIFGVRHTATCKNDDFHKYLQWFNNVNIVRGPKDPYPACDYLVLNSPKVNNINTEELWREYKYKKGTVFDYHI